MQDTVFGYRFKNPALLEEALTTPSFRMTTPEAKDNQRMEFLGDAVLGLIAAEKLFNENPNDHEGSLTVKRTNMVSAAALCAAVEDAGFAAVLKRNQGAADLPRNSKTIADAVEAVIGAAYLDGGLDAARAVVKSLGLSADAGDNPKGELQIRAQALVPPRHPEYTVIKSTGKSHAPRFTVKVSVEGLGEAVAEAGSHKEAERLAAAKLLSNML